MSAPPDDSTILLTQLVEALATGNRLKLAELFHSYPNGSRDQALYFLEAQSPHYDLVAVNTMATTSVHGGDVQPGEAYAQATWHWAYFLWKNGEEMSADDYNFYFANSSYLLLKIRLESGRYQDGFQLYEQWKPLQLPGWNLPGFQSAHLVAAECYIEAHRIDDAEAIIAALPSDNLDPTAQIPYDRLRNKIATIKTETHMSPEEMENYKRRQQLHDLRQMVDALKTVMHGHEEETDLQAIDNLIKLYEESNSPDARAIVELTQQISDFHLKAQARLSGMDIGDSIQAKRNALSALIQFFHDDSEGFNPLRLIETAEKLQELYDWFEVRELTSDMVFISWCRYICFARLEQYTEAAEALELVYTYLEKQRSQIPDIGKRAGVFAQYPHLFGALAFCHYQSQNPWQMFLRMEASKGRNLGDRMVEIAGQPDAGPISEKLREELIPILARNQAHYLSLLVDENCTYCALVTKNGRIFITANSPGHSVLLNWFRKDYASPDTWKAPASGIFGRKAMVNIPGELGKFLQPIELALNEQLLDDGDHIVYSPDGIMNLFNVQMGKLSDGRYLLERFSVSRIHSAAQLVALSGQPPLPEKTIHMFTCPAVGDEPEKRQAFEELAAYFPPGNDVPDVNLVLQSFRPGQYTHMSTHGVFPKSISSEDFRLLNPYYNSGLLLMADGKWPSLKHDFSYYNSPHLLSPYRLIESRPDLKGSYIGMQACVSGRSAEAYGGDALGLEWALFFCGTQLMVNANWNIDVHWSNRLFKRFYDLWLEEGIRPVKAHQRALLEAMQDAPTNGSLPPEYYWAGLTIAGDIR